MLRPARLLAGYPELRRVIDAAAEAKFPHELDIIRAGIVDRASQLSSGGRLETLNPEMARRQIEAMICESMHLFMFKQWGRQTYFLTSGIQTELERTDLGDIKVKDIEVPYGFFYVALENFIPLPGGGDVSVEGFYVWKTDKALTLYICLSAAPDSPKWLIPEGVHLRIPQTDGGLLGDIFIASRKYMVQNSSQGWGWEAAQQLLHLISDERLSLLPTLGSILCFLTAKPEGMIGPQVWGTTGTPFNRRRSGEQLRRGDLPIRRIELPKISNANQRYDIIGERLSPRAHWRRGHYRNQPYGKCRSKTKVVWIRPKFVNPSAGPEAEESIYEVRT